MRIAYSLSFDLKKIKNGSPCSIHLLTWYYISFETVNLKNTSRRKTLNLLVNFCISTTYKFLEFLDFLRSLMHYVTQKSWSTSGFQGRRVKCDTPTILTPLIPVRRNALPSRMRVHVNPFIPAGIYAFHRFWGAYVRKVCINWNFMDRFP